MKNSKRQRIEICLNEEDAEYVRKQCDKTNLTPGQLAKRCLLGLEARSFAAEQNAVRQTIQLRRLIGNAGLPEAERKHFTEELDKLCRFLNA